MYVYGRQINIMQQEFGNAKYNLGGGLNAEVDTFSREFRSLMYVSNLLWPALHNKLNGIREA